MNVKHLPDSPFRPAAVLLLCLLPCLAVAQQPEYVPPPPPTKNTEIDIRMRWLLSPEVSFRGLGSIPFRDDYTAENNLVLGTDRAVLYDDGFLSQDYIRTSLVEGSDIVQLQPSPDATATSLFAFRNPEQLPEDDPGVILFHRYASGGPEDAEYSADYSGSINWEINYTRYLNSKRQLGLQIGFGISGFDSKFRDSINADLYVQEFRHRIAQGERPELPEPVENADGSFTQAPFLGERIRDDVNSGNLLEWAASEQSEDTVLEGATVESLADLRSSLYNFRAGPVYNTRVFRRLALQVGAGVSALYYSGSFSAYEILNNPAGGENPSRGLSTTEQAEWQVGGYVDANLRYHFSERVNFFSGAQVYSGTQYSQFNEEREVHVDFRSQVYIHAGFGVRF